MQEIIALALIIASTAALIMKQVFKPDLDVGIERPPIEQETDYVKPEEVVAPVRRDRKQDLLDVLRSWIGYNEGNGSHRMIIDTYNNYGNLPQGYRVKYNDAWCATTVSAAAIVSNNVDIIPRECSCERFIQLCKQRGIWIEDGTITPQVGDIILYNWDQGYQPNDGRADHIGVVESVTAGQITVIEGNKNDSVGRRYVPVAWRYIRGYARPNYEVE